MKLEKKTKEKMEHGDIKAIAEKMKISTTTISNAKKNGRGSRKTIEAINEFYKNIYTLKNI